MADTYALFSGSYNPSSAQTDFGHLTTTPVDSKTLENLYGDIMKGQAEVWAREDSAYQRMVADMRKAGLNPWTGISSGGLSTNSNNRVSQALSGVMQLLDYNLDVDKLAEQKGNNLTKNLIKIFSILTGFIGGMAS